MTLEVLIIGRDSDVFAEHLGPQFPKLRLRCAHNASEALAVCDHCEILLVRNDEIFADLIAAMPRLRFIQALTTGTDDIAALPNLPAHVLVAAARGLHGPPRSEVAFRFIVGLPQLFP